MSVPPDYRILRTILDQPSPEKSPMPRRAFEVTTLPPQLIRRGRRRVIAAALVAAVLATASAQASEHPADDPPHVVRGVPLASICDACGVVSELRVQTRELPDNHVGAVAGAVVGGLAGHGIGEGSGRTVATIVGALGGGVAGNAVEKKVRRVTEWTTTVTFKDGSVASYQRTSDPELAPGDVVTIEAGNPVRRQRER
jgi:outer membrane lipoprotein SlyB